MRSRACWLATAKRLVRVSMRWATEVTYREMLGAYRALWLLQAALIIGYTVLIAAVMPEFLIEPFAPILKNLPILAILFVLYSEERRT
ncbi:DoxX-like family protein [Trinickia sp. NRRL B-1857]|uniref:DoxX-like family protein n=1 Tax=Trinickia sp. NRRL B-1857 TaxID=3162879 RepID=UPI003D28D67C